MKKGQAMKSILDFIHLECLDATTTEEETINEEDEGFHIWALIWAALPDGLY